jgi:hypothetical protein
MTECSSSVNYNQMNNPFEKDQRWEQAQMALQMAGLLQGCLNVFFLILVKTTWSSIAVIAPALSLLSSPAALYLSCGDVVKPLVQYTLLIRGNDLLLLWCSIAWVGNLTKFLPTTVGPVGLYLAQTIISLLITLAGRRLLRQARRRRSTALPTTSVKNTCATVTTTGTSDELSG